jgi:hypothetical protein
VGQSVSCRGAPVHHDGSVVLDPGTAVARLTAAAEVMAAEERFGSA